MKKNLCNSKAYKSYEKKKNSRFFYEKIIYFNKKKKSIILLLLISSLFFIYEKPIKKDIKICLCVIAKNENLYAREFVEHYKNIGYDKIFIYDNNDEKGEYFEDVINDYIKGGFVQIINFRQRNNRTSPIFDAYKDCYSKNNKKYTWLSFYDMDEFLELNTKYKTIKDFLKDKVFEKCRNIKINWLLFKNDKILYYENKPLKERIKKFNYSEPGNMHIKSTVKGNLFKNYWDKAGTPHSSNLKIKTCSSSGKLIQFDSPFNNPPDFTNAILKHYYYKSFEEYCIKIKRGKCDFPKNISNEIKMILYKNLLSESKNNSEKLKIIQKIFNDSIKSRY